MKKLVSRTLSYVICATMILSGFPIGASAQEAVLVDQEGQAIIVEDQEDPGIASRDQDVPETVLDDVMPDAEAGDVWDVESLNEEFIEVTDAGSDTGAEDATSDHDEAVQGEQTALEEAEALTNEIDVNDAGEPDKPDAIENQTASGTMFNAYLSEAVIDGTGASLDSTGTVVGQMYSITNSTRRYLYVYGAGTDVSLSLNETALASMASQVTDIIIEEGITSISAHNAFADCTALQAVRFPSTIKTIGTRAFSGDTRLASVSFRTDAKIQTIGEFAFYNCAFATFDIPSPAASNSMIEANAFSYCKNLTAFSVPSGVRVIGENAFSGCTKLETIIFPLSLKRVGSNVFEPGVIKSVYYTGTSNNWRSVDVQPGNESWNTEKIKYGIKNVSGIELDRTYIAIDNEEITSTSVTELLNVTVKPADAMNKSLTITSSNSNVASVSSASGSADDNGNFAIILTIRKQTFTTTVKSRSTTIKVTASDGGYSAECEVIVKGRETAQGPTLDGKEGLSVSTQTSRLPSATIYTGERHVLTSPTTDAQIFYTFDRTVTQSNRWNSAVVLDPDTGYYVVDTDYTSKYKYSVYECTDALIGGVSDGFTTPFAAKPMYVIAVKKGMNFSLTSVGTFAVSYLEPTIDEQGDVLDEDVPDTGIPAGLWVPNDQLENPSMTRTYTGDRITIPDLRVYYGNERLKEKTDYTLAYSNNVNSAHMGVQAPPTVNVTLKGNYGGTRNYTFTIWPKNITSLNYTYETVYLTKTEVENNMKPNLKLKVDGRALTQGSDYTLKYRKHVTGSETDSYDDALSLGFVGSFDCLVSGIGNYAGNVVIYNAIYVIDDSNSIPMTEASVSKIGVQQLQLPDEGPEPRPTLTYRKQAVPSSAYTFSYRSNTTAGTGYLVITGTGVGYTIGEDEDAETIRFVGVKTVPFTIKGIPMSKVNVLDEVNRSITNAYSVGYTGNLAEPTVRLTYTIYKYYSLTEGVDYTLSYSSNAKAGRGKITLVGKGAYTGITTRIFTINKGVADSSSVRIYGPDGDEWAAGDSFIYDYNKNKVKPEITVKYNGVTLKEKTDYVLAYANNKKPAAATDLIKPTVIVKFKGSMKGDKMERYFTIRGVDLGDCSVSLNDVTADTSKGVSLQIPTLYDTYGNKLKAGTDYLKTYEYAYAEDIRIKRDNRTILVTAGSPVIKGDIVYAGSAIDVTVTGNGYFSGKITGTYRIASKKLSNLTFTIDPQDYTGFSIQPNKKMISVSGYPNYDEAAKLYTIVSYGENVKAGTGTVVIKGINDYAGTRTLKFKILKR